MTIKELQLSTKKIIRRNINGIIAFFSKFSKNKINLRTDKPKVFYMLSPSHGNLGDQAIAYASIKYLSNLDKYEIIEIKSEYTYKLFHPIKNIISDNDIIVLHGGGNMGTHYVNEEEKRRFIINKFLSNKIICFTQTIYFSNDKFGLKELQKSKSIYNNHNNLIIFAREESSYKNMKLYFNKCTILKYPDIVFYLNNKIKMEKKFCREYITTCFRKDQETYIPLKTKELFINKLSGIFHNVINIDTVVDYKIEIDNREKELFKLWEKFFYSKIVITDRLHGMIFCAITGTPCIAIRSLDHKVTESYNWIKDLNYIKIIEDLEFDNVKTLIEELISLDDMDKFDLDRKYFDNMKDIIKNE